MKQGRKISIEELAEVIARTTKGVKPVRPQLRVVPAEEPSRKIYDAVTRDSIVRRIRTLKRMYRLGWLVEQATFGAPSLASLDDQSLSSLLQNMERARECPIEDVSFDDAGLVEDTSRNLP